MGKSPAMLALEASTMLDRSELKELKARIALASRLIQPMLVPGPDYPRSTEAMDYLAKAGRRINELMTIRQVEIGPGTTATEVRMRQPEIFTPGPMLEQTPSALQALQEMNRQIMERMGVTEPMLENCPTDAMTATEVRMRLEATLRKWAG